MKRSSPAFLRKKNISGSLMAINYTWEKSSVGQHTEHFVV
jgi:hypothetical protein